MRVFGHREPKSCRTDLEIPLGPLDAEAFAATVAAIEPQKLSRTPLADSLRAVATDLAEVTGRRTILLLTDGQETCGGDPAEAVAELAAKGIDVQVNVVGLALKSKWKSAFEDLAAQTDGRYLDAPDAASLRAALEEALTLQYVVYDERGRPAGSGAVGGQPLSLMPGTYTVTVSLAQPKTFTVTIPDGKDVVLEVK